MESDARHRGSRQSHFHPSHGWGKPRPGFSREWERGGGLAGLLRHTLRVSNCCRLMGQKVKALGQSLEALGMGSLQLWGHSGVGDVGTAVVGDAPFLRQDGENGAWPSVIS